MFCCIFVLSSRVVLDSPVRNSQVKVEGPLKLNNELINTGLKCAKCFWVCNEIVDDGQY